MMLNTAMAKRVPTARHIWLPQHFLTYWTLQMVSESTESRMVSRQGIHVSVAPERTGRYDLRCSQVPAPSLNFSQTIILDHTYLAGSDPQHQNLITILSSCSGHKLDM